MQRKSVPIDQQCGGYQLKKSLDFAQTTVTAKKIFNSRINVAQNLCTPPPLHSKSHGTKLSTVMAIQSRVDIKVVQKQ